MKTYILSLPFLLLGVIGISQNFSDPDSILIGHKKLPKVLLVGSWHFNYPGLDEHKIDENKKINIYSGKRQNELQELIEYLALFKPTKVIVESGRNTSYLINNYKAYKAGEEELYASERSQIGMRLVDRFKLDTIYGVDDGPLLIQIHQEKDTLLPETYIDKILTRHYFGGNDEISNRYSNFYTYRDATFLKHTLLENFSYLNSIKVIERGFGDYISGGQFESENNEGPDALSMFWVNRNLRIFRNIQKIGINENDRILILFGSGHIPLFRFFFKSSPLYELVDFESLKR